MADEPWPGALPSGARLGRYQVLQAVHRGSNADLYLATVHGEAGFQKEVALELACEAEPGELLARARAAISLSHANIAAIIDIGELELRGERVPYVVSEWPRGSALDGARAAGDQPLGAVLRLGAEVAKALDHAHRRVPAVSHGRLAARHVFVTEQGTVKVNGFGQPSTGPAST